MAAKTSPTIILSMSGRAYARMRRNTIRDVHFIPATRQIPRESRCNKPRMRAVEPLDRKHACRDARQALRRWRPSTIMGCYYHPAVPTAVLCRECGHEICTHCAVDSLCPGCRLGQAMKGAAQRQPVLTAIKGGSNGNGARTQE